MGKLILHASLRIGHRPSKQEGFVIRRPLRLPFGHLRTGLLRIDPSHTSPGLYFTTCTFPGEFRNRDRPIQTLSSPSHVLGGYRAYFPELGRRVPFISFISGRCKQARCRKPVTRILSFRFQTKPYPQHRGEDTLTLTMPSCGTRLESQFPDWPQTSS